MHRTLKTGRIFYTFFCVLIIIGLVMTMACHSKPEETDLLLPVEFSSIPRNLILTSPSVEKLEVRVRSTPKHIELIKGMDIKYVVDLYSDLASDPAGEKVRIDPRIYFIPVLKKRIFIPSGVEILSVKPSYIRISLEKKMVKSFSVSVPYTGAEAPGYVALSARIEPPAVTLTGPQSIIESIKSLKTKPVDLTNARESFKKKIPVDLKELNTESDPSIVTVFIPLEKKQMTKVFDDIPVELKNTRGKESVIPSKISLTIKGGHDMLNRREAREKIKVTIDVKGLKPGVYVRNAVIDMPLELIMISARPEIFTVKVE